MPVYSSHLADNYHALGVSQRIREARIKAGHALRPFAQLTGISQAQLSNIETGKAPLSIEHLHRIAGALNQPLTSLLPRTAEYPYLLTRREQVTGERPRPIHLVSPGRQAANSHNFSWPLADPFIGKRMLPVLAEIHPLADDKLQLIGHHHEEFIFVLSGEVENLIKTNDGFEKETIGRGDCLYLRSYLPHCHRSTTQEPALIVSVSYSRRGAIDYEDDELSDPGGAFFHQRSWQSPAPHAVAEKIALLRRSRRLSVDDLAARLGIGPRQLAAIEHETKSPSFDLLLKLAREFKRPVEYFLAETFEQGPSHFVLRRDQVQRAPVRLRRDPNGSSGKRAQSRFRSLAEGFQDRGIFPYHVEVKGATDTLATPHVGQEFVYLLSGELEFAIDMAGEQRVEMLRPGDSLFLDSSASHRFQGRGHSPYAHCDAETLVVFWGPIGENGWYETDGQHPTPPAGDRS